jgi:imidazolonepropionase
VTFLLIKNIKSLIQTHTESVKTVKGKNMANLPIIEDAYLLIENDVIKDFGKMKDLPTDIKADKVINATCKMVSPTWCDSHTHIVYAGSREGEFADRINGLTYEQIFERGGGILNSAQHLHNSTEEDLIAQAIPRLNEIIKTGTGAVEIKSGYGLSFEDELKMLRVIKKLKTLSPLTIKSTFLGAHAIPANHTKQSYIDLIINKMLPQIKEEKLADYCDVFCEKNYFTALETQTILEAGLKYGLQPKVHAEQLSNTGGVKAGVACKAISVDHLEFVNDKDIKALLGSSTMPTILPGAVFFLNLPLPPVRKMIDAGLPIAIASDYNPGSSPSGNMNLMVALMCIQYKLTPEEAINAATINSAYAMGLHETHGSITIGKKANVFITNPIPSYAYLPYSFGSNLIETVILNGEIQ